MLISDHILDMNGHSLYQNIPFEAIQGSMEASYQGASVEKIYFSEFLNFKGSGVELTPISLYGN